MQQSQKHKYYFSFSGIKASGQRDQMFPTAITGFSLMGILPKILSKDFDGPAERWEESLARIRHMVWVNNSLFSVINHHAANSIPPGMRALNNHKKENKEGTGWGLKLWEHLFYCIYKVNYSYLAGSASVQNSDCLSLLASSAGGLLSICAETISYVQIFYVRLQVCEWHIKHEQLDAKSEVTFWKT